jgi:hypothetical protein
MDPERTRTFSFAVSPQETGSGSAMDKPDRRQMLAWLGAAGLMLLAAPYEAAAQGKSGGKGKSGGGNGGGDGGGNSGGNSGGNANGNSSAGTKKAKPVGTVLDQDATLAAVKDGKALPLRALLPQIEQKYRGEVIDAVLQRIGRRLIYTLKMLSPGGRIFVVAVDAATGRPNTGFGLLGF